MSQPLDPLTLPLWGSRLIEASAGTGKTFTLALLYTRLILGHGRPGTAFARPLMPHEILVVTFTDAATKELRARIRQRLVEAAACFQAPPDTTPDDIVDGDPLAALRADYPPADWPGCAHRLRLAAEWMDEAVIATIHGWCHRMLQEHAFDTRGLFERELVTDQSDLMTEVVHDYWRVHFYPLSHDQAGCVLEVVDSPAALQKKLDTGLTRREAGLSYMGEPLDDEALDAVLARQCDWRETRTQLEQTARDRWRADRTALEDHLRALRPHLNGTTHGSSHPDQFDALLAEIARWSEGGVAPGKLGTFAEGAFRFKKTAKVQTAMNHPAFRAIADWQAAQAPPEPAFAACLLAHATRWVGHELERRLRVRAEMGFDDLLRQLDRALTSDDATTGVQARRLAETIRGQFPVALIDEFQDTDPVQYRIFDRVYAVQEARAETALVMIGDPKQAIYGFRGADIHAYLAARRATAGRHYTLTVNHRSTQPLVAACNHLFGHADAHPRGAFRFKTEDGNPIPYQAIRAKGRAECLILDDRETAALTFWTLEQGDAPIAPEDYRQRLAAATATQIATWLRQARSGQARFEAAGTRRPLQPRDIAILVRTGTEASILREALAARRIPSVYLSDRGSVFQTEEASDLLHWLRACASPTDEGLVRTALGTNTLTIPLDRLARLLGDELVWEEQIERFRGYRQVWRQQGVLAMLRQLMQDADLPARLVGRDHGERVLTNLLHLAEWLQQSATGIEGEQGLIRHLANHLGESGEEFILRLESDAELVQIITIHKSKGLEYPLVLLPFICAWRPVDGHTWPVPYRVGQRLALELANRSQFATAWDLADDERLSEDMRLFYVAVTRARHALWLGIAPLKSGPGKKPQLERSAIGHLLNGGQAFEDPSAVWAALTGLAQNCDHIRIAPAPSPSDSRLDPEHQLDLEPARPAPALRFPAWWIASYSSLRLDSVPEAVADDIPPAPAPRDSAETAAQETALEETAQHAWSSIEAPLGATPPPRTSRDLHAFPRGSQYGTFLHGILEWAASQRSRDAEGRPLRGYAAAAQSRSLRREMLGQRCNLRGLTTWIEPLDAWLADFLTRPWVLTGLPDADGQPPTLTLRGLAPQRTQVEMEFWLESRSVATERLDQLVQTHCLAGHPRPAIAHSRLNGMLKGFIDLVFEHAGRYYVVDWKSNWLGSDDAAYTPAAMRAAILHARYDLQYVLYLLALHRQLRARLPSYDYDRHIGGAVYVFLRGAQAESQGLFTDRPPKVLIETLDRLFSDLALCGLAN